MTKIHAKNIGVIPVAWRRKTNAAAGVGKNRFDPG
jgi:hypothetical protein